MRMRGCAGCGGAARVCGCVCGSGATGQCDDLWRPYLEGGNDWGTREYNLKLGSKSCAVF